MCSCLWRELEEDSQGYFGVAGPSSKRPGLPFLQASLGEWTRFTREWIQSLWVHCVSQTLIFSACMDQGISGWPILLVLQIPKASAAHYGHRASNISLQRAMEILAFQPHVAWATFWSRFLSTNWQTVRALPAPRANALDLKSLL